jgi:hypothetical protein
MKVPRQIATSAHQRLRVGVVIVSVSIVDLRVSRGTGARTGHRQLDSPRSCTDQHRLPINIGKDGVFRFL